MKEKNEIPVDRLNLKQAQKIVRAECSRYDKRYKCCNPEGNPCVLLDEKKPQILEKRYCEYFYHIVLPGWVRGVRRGKLRK